MTRSDSEERASALASLRASAQIAFGMRREYDSEALLRSADRIQYNYKQILMILKTMLLLPKLQNLPKTLPLEGAVRIELVEGIPIFRASSIVQNRIEELLEKQQNSPLNSEEEQELDLYEEIDDYFSFINRTVRNLYLSQSQSDV